MQPLSYQPEDVARIFEELRLPGIARVFAQRYSQAVDQQLGNLEFLGRLLEEEAIARKQRRFERLIKSGNLDMTDCLENYDFELARTHGVDPAMVRDLVGGEYIRHSRNIVLAGAVGTGKTKLARTLGFEAARREYKTAFEYTRELVEKLYQLRNSYNFTRVYRHYVNLDLLVLDDLAYMPFAPEKVDFLFRLIFDRSEKKTGPVIVTTNTDVKEWWSFFPSKAMGMAFSDRVLGGAVGIKFIGPSIRRRARQFATKATDQVKDSV
jgi:DNA replication protein DnaC